MYNSQVIRELLDARDIRIKDFVSHVGGSTSSSLDSVIKGDIRVSKLEKIADFFGVSMDTFFSRDYGKCTNSVNVSGNQSSNIPVSQAVERERNMRDLLSEKDKRIELLEEMISMLKSNK